MIAAAAAVEGSFFKDFALLEKKENSQASFEIQGEVDVSQDFSTFRKIQVGIKDFKLKQGAAEASD